MKCAACGKAFEPKYPTRAKYCSPTCRLDAWAARKAGVDAARLRGALRRVAALLEEAAEEVRAALRGKEGKP